MIELIPNWKQNLRPAFAAGHSTLPIWAAHHGSYRKQTAYHKQASSKLRVTSVAAAGRCVTILVSNFKKLLEVAGDTSITSMLLVVQMSGHM